MGKKNDTATIAVREAARKDDGKFGTQTRPKTDTALTAFGINLKGGVFDNPNPTPIEDPNMWDGLGDFNEDRFSGEYPQQEADQMIADNPKLFFESMQAAGEDPIPDIRRALADKVDTPAGLRALAQAEDWVRLSKNGK